MKYRIFKIFIGLCTVLVACSDNQHTSKNLRTGSIGLLIDNGGYRGSGFTDSTGTEYNLRQIPIRITNDSAIPVHIEINFAKAYAYSGDTGDEKFRVFPLPEEWASGSISDSTYNILHAKLPEHIYQPTLKRILAPGDSISIAIGTIYPKPGDNWWVVPHELFVHENARKFPECDWIMNKVPSLDSQAMLGLQLRMGSGCRIIPCGQISYSD